MYLVYSDYIGEGEYAETKEKAIQKAKNWAVNEMRVEDNDTEIEIYKLCTTVNVTSEITFDIKDVEEGE